MTDLFSDRENIRHPPPTTAIDPRTWTAILSMVERRLADGSLGFRFPLNCVDQPVCIGANDSDFNEYVEAHVPGIYRALDRDLLPGTAGILDFIELVGESVGKPVIRAHHNFFGHNHLDFNREAGLAEFVQEINRLFRRNGVQFELSSDGRIRRLGPPVLRQTVQNSNFATGDATLDGLLGDACNRIFSRSPNENRIALEKLWDAFERTKDLEPGATKPTRIAALLNRATVGTGPYFQASLADEAAKLNEIGNSLQIRHHGQNAEAVTKPEQIDALFMRMFSFLYFVLAATGRTR